jgi:diketogulonate reductase-like aldo/keto reductase
MEKLYDDGLCRAIGVCNFEITHLEKLMKACRIKPMINQFELHPMFRQKELCEYCEKQGIAIMSYSPLARMNKNLLLQKLFRVWRKKPIKK